MSKRRKKILFVLGDLHAGEAEKVVVTLLRRLDRSRFEPHLALLATAGPFLKNVPDDVPVLALHFRRARYIPKALIPMVWRLRPDLVFSTQGYLNLFVILSGYFFPRASKLVVREGTVLSAALKYYSPSTPRIWKWLFRALYKDAGRIICNSDFITGDLAGNFHIPRSKTVRIYNPVEIEEVRELGSASGNPYAAPGPHLVAVGRLSAEKGFDRLLEAFVLVRQVFVGAQLSILGYGPLEKSLRARREDLGLTQSVHFLGFCSNPYPFMRHAAVLVLPSRFEGLPMVVLEAVALGTPVVAADCPGGIREIALPLDCVRLARSNDPAGLAEAIVQTLAARRDPHRALNDREFARNFGLKEILSQYESLFDSV